jgi:hypothetical protein
MATLARGKKLDSYELEPCDRCYGGIVETCEKCVEIEELWELIEEDEYRNSRRG